MKNVFISAVTL